MTKSKWFVYTVSVGLIPVLARLLLWLMAGSTKDVSLLNTTDFVGFSLVLVATNISGLEHESFVDQEWKTRSMGISFFVVALLATVFVAACLSDTDPAIFNQTKVLAAAIFLSVGTLIHSYALWDRLLKIRTAKEAVNE